ncbi:MAG: beta-galactosidase [Acidobacteria bacterium ACB1]|nr:beta-galactosidase [Acidobacteria bacterium ACB1]RIJ95567.1 MAG: beta-galactosidase [Acidobacteriota bacterium]
MTRSRFVLVFLVLLVAAVGVRTQVHSFSLAGEHFMLDGKPFVIRSGEMHYPRVPREHWRERFRMAKAMGLNAITTYVFWNLHEKTQGKFDFSGNLDIAEYARIAQEEGLFLIVRPGPYICTEWDFGGFPGWLLREKDMKVRTRDPKFLSAAARYMKEVGKQLAPHQITNGGNIILVQVENEYGSFGGDHEYMNAVKRSIVDAGFTVPLFTSDGPGENFLQRGTLPDVAAVINMGTVDDPAAQWANFARFRQNVPRMVGEYWIGWFDHWGEKHHTATIESVTRGIDYFLKNNISFNIYMFHGGWSFGYMAGANYSDTVPYQPDTSDYDYDSPLDAGGRPTPKFYAIRELIKRYFPDEKIPEVVDRTKFIELPKTSLKDTASLEDAVRLVNPIASERPLPMESVGQNFGFILYRKRLDRVINGKVEFNEQRDYSHVFVNGKFVGKLDRRLNEQSITINAKTGDTLDVLVENMGRINYGERLMYDRKGITESVHFGSDELKGWQIYRLPFDDLSRLRFSTKQIERPVFFRGSFSLKSVGDTFLDMRKWGKGHVWVNGHHLGRFWNIGPQQSLYLPAGWLKKGRNTIVILDLENDGARTVTGGKDILYETK